MMTTILLIHWLLVLVCMFPTYTGYVLGLNCEDISLGMQNSIIPADKITASSGAAGDHARLNYTDGPAWCAMGNDTNPYLQIDLGTPHIICAVSTQGDHQKQQWVRTFTVNFSDDGETFHSYKENGNIQQTFYGNVDGSGIVKQILYQGITARYLRILPIMHRRGAVCMKAEIYGIQIQSENLALTKIAEQSSTIHNGYASRAIDGNRDGNWLSGSCTHCDQNNVLDWWRVDLGYRMEVEEISVFTRTHPEWALRLWNTTFEVRIGHVTGPKANPKCGGQYGIIPSGSITIVCNPTRNGRYVIITQENEGQLSLCEVEVYGQANVAFQKDASQSSLSKTYHSMAKTAVDGIYSSINKCTTTDYEKDYPWWMVDLGKIVPVFRVRIFSHYHYTSNIFQIRIGNDNLEGGRSNQHCAERGGNRIWITCQSAVLGRYLSITFNELHTFPNKVLSLCEVEVYAKDLVCTRKAIGRGIPNHRITANSTYSNIRSRSVDEARLLGNSSWRPRDDDPNPWLQIDLGTIYYVCAVATQGDPKSDERTTKYKIEWSFNGNWRFIRNVSSNNEQIFTGNRDKNSIIKHIFPTPLTAEKIRFYPVEKNIDYALRVELYGIKKQGPQIPNLIGKIKLDPRNESHVDLVCQGERGLDIKWYHNDTDITSYSVGTVRTGSTLMSKLRVNYTSADDVYDRYSCGEVISLKRRCNSLEYVCYVDYGSYSIYQGRGKVTILLGVPNPPTFQIQNVSRSAARIMIKQPNRTADQAKITKYSIELDEKKIAETNQSTYNLRDLKPYRNYTVRVMASSKIGNSKWSKSETFTTQSAEPSAAPKNVNVSKVEDGKYEISWDEIPQEHANGKILTYEINWKPVSLERKRRAVVPPSRAVNATSSPYLLEGLSLNVSYNVSIRGYSQAGPGPFSVPITINKVIETKSKDGTSLASSSSESAMLIIIAVASVVSVLIIVMIAMIVIIVLRKRHKKRDEKVTRVHFAARISEANVEGPLIEENKDKDEQNQEDINSIEEATSSGAIYGNSLNPDEATSSLVPVGQFMEYMRKVGKDENKILTDEFENMENGEQFPSVVARKLVNKTKNRYGNIVPYDHSRVVLEKVKEDEDSDYINASYIRGFDGKHISYIASQGPVTKTIEDFWRMIWQEKTSVIVMLTGLKEGHKTKCEKYWPEDCETYLDISVELQKTEVFADYSIRSFFLTKTKTSEQRCVFQYHFTAWPDKGVPQHATQLLAFRRRLLSDTAMVCPWVVHCSAGVGRTGAFLAVDAMLRQAQEKKTIDILNFVKMMRENRPYMVQTPEQYIFVHMAILEFLTCGVTEIRAQQLKEEMNKLAKVDEMENLSGYEVEFKHLSHVCPPVQDDEITAGNKPCNNRKNRFPNIVPLDKGRVFLQADVDEEGANYINASYANGYRQRHAYILTQAPLDTTIDDFWKMIYDNQLGTIVMLNNLQEENEEYPKYWPQEGSEQFGDITVEIVKEEDKNCVTSRTFQLTHKSDGAGGRHEVRHYSIKDWSDGSVPNNIRTVLDLIEMLQRSQQQSDNKSIVVQCSDGVGRSGTLCTILSLLDRVKTEQMVDVFQTVKALRISRPGAVETAVQYRFCFELVMSYLDSFSDYSNFND